MRTLISTIGSSGDDGFDHWRAAVSTRFLPMDITKYGNGPFEGILEGAVIAGFPLTRVTQSASTSELTARQARAGDKGDNLLLKIKIAGVSYARQNDRASVQRAGELVLFENAATVLDSMGETTSYYLEIPREKLERLYGPAKIFTSLTIGADQASTGLVTSYFRELAAVHERLTVDAAERLMSIGLDLVAASIAERLARDTPKPLHSTMLVHRAKAYIEANLGDPTLDPNQLAGAVGVSLRQLQKLFHERGRHISDWIWQRRLEVAAKRLADPGFSHVQIGNLAYGCGFLHQSHFSRRFKSLYGMSPSEYRQVSLFSPERLP